MTPYERYCQLRDEKGVKDKTVADAIGTTRSTFSDWKSGRSVPKADKMIKIAKYFEVSYPYLMCLSDDRQTSPHTIDMTAGYDIVMQRLEEHMKETFPEDEASLSYDPEVVEKAMTIYEKYEKANAKIQEMIDYLLNNPQ